MENKEHEKCTAPLPRQGGKDVQKTMKDTPNMPEKLGNVKKTINVSDNLYNVVNNAVDALQNVPEIYQRDGRLVRVAKIGEDERSKNLPVGSLVIRPVAGATLKEKLTCAADFVKYDARKGELAATKPPGDVVSAVLERIEFPSVRTIVGISESPFMRPDGTVCDVTGYDRESGFIFNPEIDFPKVPQLPTKEQAAAAYALLSDPFTDFPFVDETHRAVAVSGVLSILARPMLGNIPAKVIEASTRGIR